MTRGLRTEHGGSGGFGWSFFSVGGRRPGQIGGTVLRPRREEKDVESGPSQPSWETQRPAAACLPASLPGDVQERSPGGVSGGRVWIGFKFRES